MRASGRSAMDVKRLNRNAVYRYLLKKGSCLRTDISESLTLSAPTVLAITNELSAEGLIREAGKDISTGGRKPVILTPVYDRKYSVGIDITQNHVSFALTDLSGKLKGYQRISQKFVCEEGYPAGIAAALEGFLDGHGIERGKLLGVGWSIPGIISEGTEEVVVSHALRIRHLPFSFFSNAVPYPSSFINDANAAAYCEATAEGQEPANFFYFSLSNTVGGALVSANREDHAPDDPAVSCLRYGDRRKCGEVGHMTLYPGGKRCYCGQRGCFDAYCAAAVLSSGYDGRIEAFMEALESGDRDARLLWNGYLDDLALMINNIHTLLDTDIVLGGYVGSYLEKYLPELNARLANMNTFQDEAPYLRACRFKVEASAFGAALTKAKRFIVNV